MVEKIAIEEQKKIFEIKEFIIELKKRTIGEPHLAEKKDQLIAILENNLVPLGVSISNIKEIETEIDEILSDEILDDTFFNNPLYEPLKNYMRFAKNRDILLQQSIRTLSQFILEFADRANDIGVVGIRPKFSFIDDGEPKMNEEERQYIKIKAETLILHYKKEDSKSIRRALMYTLYNMADTREKYALINDRCFELTGQRLLDEMKKIQEARKKEQEAKDKMKGD